MPTRDEHLKKTPFSEVQGMSSEENSSFGPGPWAGSFVLGSKRVMKQNRKSSASIFKKRPCQEHLPTSKCK